MWILFGSFIILTTIVFSFVAQAEPRQWALGKAKPSNKVAPVQIDVAELCKSQTIEQALDNRRRDSFSSSDGEDTTDGADDDRMGILPTKKRDSRKSIKVEV